MEALDIQLIQLRTHAKRKYGKILKWDSVDWLRYSVRECKHTRLSCSGRKANPETGTISPTLPYAMK
jgi:hypothetical protein